MINYGKHNNLEAGPEKGQRKGLTSHPYRVLELVRRKRTQSSDRNGQPNRTIIKFKRRQGSLTSRKGAVARTLKQFSFDNYKHPGGDSLFELASNMKLPVKGEGQFIQAESKSMASRQRDDRNPGGTRSFLDYRIVGVGESTNRSEPIWLRVADRLTCSAGQAICIQQNGPTCVEARRQNNVARKGNMD